MKCVVCGQRKGKRRCPAKAALICAPCCGEKRVVEIPCPADCEHLQTGQSYHVLKNSIGLLESESNPARRHALYTALTEWGLVIDEIEEVIVSYAAGLRSLSDTDVLEAVELQRRTLETERKGVLFEHRSPNPIVQSLVREIGRALEVLRNGPSKDSPPPKLDDLIESLKAIEAGVRHRQKTGQSDAYLRFTAVNHPEAAVRGRSGGLITP